MVEFALSAILLSIILSGAVEFGFIFGHKIEINNAARAGARWAADYSISGPSSPLCTTAPCWSGAASPNTNTIEGQVRNAGGTAAIPNDDSHIFIQYYSAAGVLCGHVHVSGSTASFVADGAPPTGGCIARGNLVSVAVTNTYPLFTRLFPVAPSLSSSVTFEVMN